MAKKTEMKTKSLTQWFGADGMVADRYARQLDGVAWCGVPFAGGMSIVPHLTARSLLIGDRHAAMVNLAKVAASAALGPKLYRAVRRLPLHPDILAAAQARCIERERAPAALASIDLFGSVPISEQGSPPDLDWAIDYFVSVWMGQGGRAGTKKELEGGMSYRWNAGGGGSVVRYRSAAASYVAWRKTLERGEFVWMDAFDFLDQVYAREVKESAKPEHKRERRGLYVDCPWVGAGEDYKHTFTLDQHRQLATSLGRFAQTRVVIRYGDAPLIRELYPPSKWNVLVQTSRTQANELLPELMILNQSPVAEEGAAA